MVEVGKLLRNKISDADLKARRQCIYYLIIFLWRQSILQMRHLLILCSFM